MNKAILIRDAIVHAIREAGPLTLEESEELAASFEAFKAQTYQLATDDIKKRTALPPWVRIEHFRGDDAEDTGGKSRISCGKCGDAEWFLTHDERQVILLRDRWRKTHHHVVDTHK